MRISDWSSDVCSSDLQDAWLEPFGAAVPQAAARIARRAAVTARQALAASSPFTRKWSRKKRRCSAESWKLCGVSTADSTGTSLSICTRSEEHTSELQSLMRISYAVFCLKKKI